MQAKLLPEREIDKVGHVVSVINPRRLLETEGIFYFYLQDPLDEHLLKV
jgi:hypothetical protein